ncbi:MAG: cysteine desulfurase family protein [Bacteroidota bacterium]
MKVYLDNAASTPMDPEVFEQMKPFFCEWVGNPSSTHAHGRPIRNQLEEARRTIAAHLNCTPAEIIFTSGGTEADNMAIVGAVESHGLTHVISTQIEHHAVTHTIEHLEATGKIEAIWLAVDEKGNIDLGELRTHLQAHPKSLVTLMHGNNEIGTLHDLQAIGEVCREHEVLFHSDTVQTMGHFAYDLAELPVDMMSASAHKFYGPKGVGFLYLRKGVRLPSFIMGGSQERDHRAGTENVPGIMGMAFAFDKCQKNLATKTEEVWGLKEYLKTQLETRLPGIHFNGETSRERSLPTVLNTCLPCDGSDCLLLFNLDLFGISASGGSACNAGANMGSHVLRGIGANENALMNSIRFSFSQFNTKAELDYVVEKLSEVVLQPAG